MGARAVTAGVVAMLVAPSALAACSDGPNDDETAPTSAAVTASSTAPPDVSGQPPSGLDVEVVTDDLEHGWDVGFLPDGSALVTERGGRIQHVSSLEPGAEVSEVEADLDDVFARGEGGLLGMVVHPDFATSREFTTCMNHEEDGDPVDIRLVTWQLADDARSATRVRELLTGLPISSGRHSGCRPAIAADGALIVGTGDVAVGSHPQDLTSLGGKVLRLDLQTGKPLPDNPFGDAADERQRYVYSYGHRNLQGVTIQPGTGEIYTAEHGPSENDEVNRIEPGANYGWDPAQGGTVGGYDEDVPMTDTQRYPDAVDAVWKSGSSTEAICGAEFLAGSQWAGWDGALAVTALKGSKLLVLSLNDDGTLAKVAIPPEAQEFGRLRAARLGPDGALYVTTSNGEDDALLRVTPTT